MRRGIEPIFVLLFENEKVELVFLELEFWLMVNGLALRILRKVKVVLSSD